MFISDSPAAFPLPGVDLLCSATADDLAEARLLVENAIVRVAAARVSEQHCTALAEEVTEMYASADDPADFYVHDLRFHRAMARACGNPILAAMAEALLARVNAETRVAGYEGGELRKIAELHRAIYRAIRIHQPGDASSPLRPVSGFTSRSHAVSRD